MNLVKLLLEINKIVHDLSSNLDQEDLGLILFEKINTLTKIDTLAIGMIDEEKEEILYNFLIVKGKALDKLLFPLEKESSLAYYCVSNKEVVVINNIDNEYKKYIKKRKLEKGIYNTKSLIFIPLFNKDKTLGFMTIQDESINTFDKTKILFLKEIAKYMALILTNLEKEKELNSQLANEKRLKKEMTETNEILEYVNSFVYEVMNLDSLESVVNKIITSFKELYDIDRITLTLYKPWLKKKDIFIGNVTNDYLEYLEDECFEEAKRINDDKNCSLQYNNINIGHIHIEAENFSFEKVHPAFTNLIALALSNILESLKLEMEIEEKRALTSALKQSYENLQTINKIGEEVTSTLDLHQIGMQIYKNIKNIFEGDCTIGLASYNEKKEEVYYEFWIDYGKLLEDEPFHINEKPSYTSWTIKNRKMLVINNEEKERDKYIDSTSFLGISYTKSLIYIPLFIRSKLIGVFTFQREEKNYMDNYTIEVLSHISNFLAIALNNAIESKKLSNEIIERTKIEEKLRKANIILEKLSNEDSLTGLYNRRYFEKSLEKVWLKARDKNEHISLLIIDLDYFKQVNDTFGHLEGDNYLLHVATILKKYQSKVVTFGRYGGDEFIGLFTKEMALEVEKVAEKIMADLNNLHLPNPAVPNSHLTLTIGLSIIIPNETLNLDDFFRNADRALYVGKEKGRNRIIKF